LAPDLSTERVEMPDSARFDDALPEPAEKKLAS
jgi:hypothetical protein